VETRSETGKQAGLDSRPEHIKQVAESSLKRLRTKRSLSEKLDQMTGR